MIVVTVELHSAVTGKVTTLGRAVIANDGTGSVNTGHYDICIGRKGQRDLRRIFLRPQWHGRVSAFPRQQLNVWRLLARGLEAAFK